MREIHPAITRLTRATYLASVAAVALMAAPVAAQGGFDEGSFGGGSFDEGGQGGGTPAQTTQPAGDNFGGSFDGGGSFDDGTGGGGSFDDSSGGSFDDSGGGSFAPPPGGQEAANTDENVPGGGDFDGGGGSFGPGPSVTPGDQVVGPGPTPGQDGTFPGGPTRPDPGAGDQAAKLLAFETRDFGVPPQQQLRQGQFHAQTPTAIPGGKLVTTVNLVNAVQQGTQILMIDVLGGQYTLPGAFSAPPMAQPGSFGDRTQQQTAQWLGQITRGQKGMPIVIFCSDPMCWLSYNASLRAIAAGYTNVYWYRGGLAAWQMAGLQMMPGGY